MPAFPHSHGALLSNNGLQGGEQALVLGGVGLDFVRDEDAVSLNEFFSLKMNFFSLKIIIIIMTVI